MLETVVDLPDGEVFDGAPLGDLLTSSFSTTSTAGLQIRFTQYIAVEAGNFLPLTPEKMTITLPSIPQQPFAQ